MRKFSISMMLCIILVSSAFLASCSKDETSDSSNPITELVFPASDANNPIYTGDLVEIGGKGFADDCEIWLQGADGKEVKVAITVSSAGVSFIAPNILGQYTVVLKQGREVYALGSLFFAKKLPSVFTGKRVTRILTQYGQYSHSEEFAYSQGSLIKNTYDSDDGRSIFNITYTGNQVKMIAEDQDVKEELLYTLNAEGYAVSAISTDVYKSDKYTMTQSFEYEDGYLVKITTKDEESYESIIQIKYMNGNVTSYSEKGVDDEGPFEHTGTNTYFETLNKGGILPPDQGWLEAGDGYLPIAYYAGILGKPTTNLAKTSNSTSYEYEMKDEYVEKCTVMSNGTNREVVSYSFE